MSRVLVTGASGFLGKRVVDGLIKRGFEVHAVSRSGPGKNASSSDAFWHALDLHDRSAVRSVLSHVKPNGLIHLAWDTSHGSYWNSSENLEWTATSLALAKEFHQAGGRRALLAGSSAEYAWKGASPLIEALSPLEPDSLYGICKNGLREMIEAWAPGAGLSFAWGRIFNIYGENEKPGRLVPRVIRGLLNGEIVEFKDDGNQKKDFLSVREAADAFVAIYESRVQGPINVASGVPVTVREMVQRIASCLGRSDRVRFGAETDKAGANGDVVAAVDRLREEVGWKPRADLSSELQVVCDWWRSHHAVGHFEK